MHLQALLLSAFTSAALGALNEPCYGSGGVAGVCVTTATCSASGGVTITGGCPSDPSDVKCCSKTTCANGSSGNCRWTSDCAGTTVSNQCPGPSAFKCCSSNASGFGGYSAPTIPTAGTSSGACKAVSVSGAQKVVAAWPGRVREIFCTRACACPGTSDHCCGKAIDLMCSDGGGVCDPVPCDPGLCCALNLWADIKFMIGPY